jgi:hypothetical protein
MSEKNKLSADKKREIKFNQDSSSKKFELLFVFFDL